MSGKVLYRKYRPTKLEDVVGQEQVTNALSNAIKNHKIGHAYLFIGPRGTGKTSVARIFAHAVNKFKYEVEDSYLDIIEIDAASNTGVDNIRELREKAIIAPTKGKYKVYIIDEVHMLTKSASNALLKTLEEPPEHVIFIMATTDAHKVPITISSRTQVFTFKLADPAVMFEYLQKVAKKEKIKITNEALKLIVRRGGGSFRDSMSLLDQVANLLDDEITVEVLSQALGLPQDQILQELLLAYSRKDSPKIQQLLKELLNTGIKPEIIASELIHQIIAQPAPAYLSLLAKLPEVQPPFPEAKLLLAFLSGATAQPVTTPPIITSAPPVTAPTPTIMTATSTPNSTPQPQPQPAPVANPATHADDNIANDTTTEITTAQPAPEAFTEDFNWDTFLNNVHSESDGLFQQLQKVDYEIASDTLHLYPSNKFTLSVLKKPDHSRIILKHSSGLAIEVHDLGAKPAPKDETLSQISAIMGDIKEVKGDLPF